MAGPGNAWIAPLVGFVARLRFPWLFGLTAALFVADLVVPDVIPFADEVLLGLGASLLASWKKNRDADAVEQPDSTP